MLGRLATEAGAAEEFAAGADSCAGVGRAEAQGKHTMSESFKRHWKVTLITSQQTQWLEALPHGILG